MTELYLAPPLEGDPIVAVSISDFDMMSGSKLVHLWKFVPENISEQITSLSRMTLSTLPRQKESAFNKLFTTALDIASSDWFVVSTIFKVPKSKPNLLDVYYSVAIILKSSHFKKTQHLIDGIKYYSQQLVIATQFLISRSENFEKMTEMVQNAVIDVCKLFHVGLKPLDFQIDPSEQSLYAQILTAHLRAQMNTIFEVNSFSECERFFNFLTHFTLPDYLAYSSSELRARPNMFLHLQVIQKQNYTPEEILLQSPTPRALVRLPEKIVVVTPAQSTHVPAMEEYKEIRASAQVIEDPDQRKKKLKSRSINYKAKSINSTQQISTAVKLIEDIQIPSKSLVCEQRLAVFVRTAITLIALVQDYLDENNSSQMTHEQTLELQKTLKLKDKNDLDIILAFAAIYDENIFDKVPPMKEQKSIFS